MSRDLNHFAFVDLRDRFGITQCVFRNTESEAEKALYNKARNLGREVVIQVSGKVVERSNKFAERATGDIEVEVDALEILSVDSKPPPFKIEDVTDANEDTRMQYRFLDLRRNPVKDALMLRSKVNGSLRRYLQQHEFMEIETPILIKSTPEGARDFVVPSRMNPGQFYALPQSPQTFKQLCMVGGLERYFQIARCFRDEELRSDRQPEFTQVDCELSFVGQEDVLRIFEGLMVRVFDDVLQVKLPKFQRMTYDDAMKIYGIDKPDLRFGMTLVELTDLAKGKGFKVFDDAELVVSITCPGAGEWPNKRVKELENVAKGQEVGAGGLVWTKVKSLEKKEFDSSAKKFFSAEDFAAWAKACDAKDGDLICCFSGKAHATREAMGKFRNYMGKALDLPKEGFQCLWVVDFPLLEYDEELKRYFAMHHPFTSPRPEDMHLMDTEPGKIRASAYDMVINGVEVGGGSVRIHDRQVQGKMFDLLGFTKESAEEQFGFLLGALEYGAPPHAGLALGLDRLCQILGGGNSIRDYIAFPKNNKGRDVMINAPSAISGEQLEELNIKVDVKA